MVLETISPNSFEVEDGAEVADDEAAVLDEKENPDALV